jgi:hypothetical protein
LPQRTSACSSSVSSSRWRLSVSSVRKSSPYRASRAWFPREARSDVTESTLRFCSLHRRSLSRNIMSSSCCHTLVITPVLLTKSRIKTPGQGVWVCALCAPRKLAQRGKNTRHMKPRRKLSRAARPHQQRVHERQRRLQRLREHLRVQQVVLPCNTTFHETNRDQWLGIPVYWGAVASQWRARRIIHFAFLFV